MTFEMNELQNINRIHLIGVGGISMSGIAEILLEEGYNVSGSDMHQTPITNHLEEKGATLYYSHDGKNVHGAQLIVYSAAIKEDNPERIRGVELGIPAIDRAKMLGQIMKNYDHAIAIAGSHGKTTTTSFVSLLLEYSNMDPTIMVGGNLDEIGGNIKIGKSQYFVTEACEYFESFLQFRPRVGVLLNIDRDHLDYFKDIDHIIRAFESFANLIPDRGYLVAFNDNHYIQEMLPRLGCKVVTYGVKKDSHFMAKNITFNLYGHARFDLFYMGENLGPILLQVPGLHNIYNALAAIATVYLLGVPMAEIQDNIGRFKGIHRRFDIIGKVKGATIVDDYAHHPVEIEATLAAAQKVKHNTSWCVFQPHTYSRTEALLEDFSRAFSECDHVILTDIYAAREKDEGVVSSRDLYDLMKDHKSVRYLRSFEEVRDYLYENINSGDLVLTMGAGDVNKIGEMLLELETADSEYKVLP